MIVATAGHVDHGKTELIKALTGIDTDHLPEEKARGLSVDLGFAYQRLPDSVMLGFVDVPGHKKFIRNMLAGVAGIDLGLLVVAADDGVMPQTREHLAILNLLGIKKCLVALTKIDRVQPNRTNEVRLQLKRFLADAGRDGCDVYPICAPKGEGIDDLSQALFRHAKACSSKADTARVAHHNFRMAIDRVFSLKGVGLIVTGMVLSGLAHTSQSLTLSSTGSQVRIRGIKVNSQTSDCAKAGERCALNITGRGIREHSVRRGNWLMHHSLYCPTKRIDVDLEVLQSEEGVLKHWTPTHLHIGSDHLPARVAILSGGGIAAGKRGLTQLVLDRDTFVCHGDRFVLRDQSAQRTIAGGRVIDPFSPKRGRAKPRRIASLKAMYGDSPAEILQKLTDQSETGVSLQPFGVSHNLPAPQINALIASLGLRLVGRAAQERAFCEKRWQELLDRIEKIIVQFHQSNPALFGASIKDIQTLLTPFFETVTLEAALNLLVAENRLGAQGKKFYSPSHAVHISAKDKSLLARAKVVLAPPSGTPPNLYQAAKDIGVDVFSLEKALKIGVKLGDFVMIEKNRYLPKTLLIKFVFIAEQLVARSDDGLFTTANYRDEVNLGRNLVIAILEYFDRIGFTMQVGNHRRVRCSAESIFLLESKD